MWLGMGEGKEERGGSRMGAISCQEANRGHLERGGLYPVSSGILHGHVLMCLGLEG